MNNDIKPRLKGILSNRRGRARAITRRELRDTLGLDDKQDRKLRLIIAKIRAEGLVNGLPVLFATKKPAGYYVPATWDELRAGLDSFRSYIVALCVQRARIKKVGERSLYSSKQGMMF